MFPLQNNMQHLLGTTSPLQNLVPTVQQLLAYIDAAQIAAAQSVELLTVSQQTTMQQPAAQAAATSHSFCQQARGIAQMLISQLQFAQSYPVSGYEVPAFGPQLHSQSFMPQFAGVPVSAATSIPSNVNMTHWLTPAIDISEDDDSFEIWAEMPGVSEKNVEVYYNEGFLTLRGRVQPQSIEKGRQFHSSERHSGVYQRLIPLGVEINEGSIKANVSHGIVRITLPKSKSSKAGSSRRVTVVSSKAA